MTQVHKLCATGNDFLLAGLHTPEAVNQWALLLGKYDRRTIALKLCDRHEGIGADGMLFFSSHAEADFSWDFYNQDGSRADMCGNAARCAGLWAARTCGGWRDFNFKTAAGLVGVSRLENGLIEVLMTPVRFVEEELELKLSTGRSKVCWVDSGVPHVVLREESLKELDALKSEAQEIRRYPDFGEAGTNVTFYVERDPSHISILTFERGVEDFTKACGTGAVAAAYVHHRKRGEKFVHVQVPGGSLHVDLSDSKPRLSGPAHWVADCTLDLSPDGVLPT